MNTYHIHQLKYLLDLPFDMKNVTIHLYEEWSNDFGFFHITYQNKSYMILVSTFNSFNYVHELETAPSIRFLIDYGAVNNIKKLLLTSDSFMDLMIRFGSCKHLLKLFNYD